MANVSCPAFLQGDVVRVTRLDSCGVPDYGDCGFAVSSGWVELTFTPNIEDGERFLQRNAAGVPIINQRSRPSINWYDLSIQFSEVDFELFSILTGFTPNVDDQDRTIGLTVTETDFASANFALEAWLGNREGACSQGGVEYGYVLFPWIVDGAMTDDVTVTNDKITFTVTGRTRRGTPWGVGPYDVTVDLNDDPSALFDPLPTDTHMHIMITTTPPPVAACGCQALSS